MGERKDANRYIEFFVGEYEITLDSFTDLNVNFGYRLNEQLTFFVKGNNLLGNNYHRWANYPVLGFQVMGGGGYRFDW